MVYSAGQFVVCFSVCHFVLVFFSPFGIAIASLGEGRAGLGAFHAFVWFLLVWIFRFPLPLGVWEGLRFVIVALPGLFSYLFCKVSFSSHTNIRTKSVMNVSCKVAGGLIKEGKTGVVKPAKQFQTKYGLGVICVAGTIRNVEIPVRIFSKVTMM